MYPAQGILSCWLHFGLKIAAPHSQSGWKGPQEIPSSNSCLRHSHLWDYTLGLMQMLFANFQEGRSHSCLSKQPILKLKYSQEINFSSLNLPHFSCMFAFLILLPQLERQALPSPSPPGTQGLLLALQAEQALLFWDLLPGWAASLTILRNPLPQQFPVFPVLRGFIVQSKGHNHFPICFNAKHLGCQVPAIIPLQPAVIAAPEFLS